MIPVPKLTNQNEPPLFETNCRQPGNAYLEAHPSQDPHEKSPWWSQFKPDLAKHFTYRCGWTAMTIHLDGHVDHFLACGNRKGNASPHRHLAFEWTNFRYASGTVNSRKGNHDDTILDPCNVEDGWFEIVLPNFTLRPTDRVPADLLQKVKFTIKELKLFNHHDVRYTRWAWYQRYWNEGNPQLDLLEKDAPLVAAAVRKALNSGVALPNPEDCLPGYQMQARKRKYRKRIPKHTPPANEGIPTPATNE